MNTVLQVENLCVEFRSRELGQRSKAAAQWLQCNRDAWNIEAMHNKLDVSHDEDRSRVRHPNAMLVLSLFRRWSNSLFMHWRSDHRKTEHKTTTDFFNDMSVQNHRSAI